MAMSRSQLLSVLNALLQPERFRDYCPNGLQVEGQDSVQRLVTGVTASQALLDEAVRVNADAILVHHGYFWKSESPTLTGMKGARIRTLMRADINLFAYHLPLDAHHELGNNAGLGRALALQDWHLADPDDPSTPVFVAEYDQPRPLDAIKDSLNRSLGRSVLVEGEKAVRRVAWCTGGGQGYIDLAADLGADLFVTGEVSEQTIHIARERNLAFIAAGHHATERFGAQAVGEWLAREHGLSHQFIDIDNPA